MSQPEPAAELYRARRQAHWNAAAERWRGWGGYYHQRLSQIYQSVVMPNQRVLELGCGPGDLLAALRPSQGVGVDFSAVMIERARRRHPQLQFVQTDVHQTALEGTFDYIILSDLVNDLWDVQTTLEQIAPLTHPGTRLVLNTHSRLWEGALGLARRIGWAQPVLEENWLTVEDLSNLLVLAGFEPIRAWPEIVLPVSVPGLTPLVNRFIGKLWPFTYLAFTNFLVARPSPAAAPAASRPAPSVSVVIAARNEAGNIPEIFARVPALGPADELIFVEGHSRDDTYAVIEREIARHPERPSRLFKQPGQGKADAIRTGFEAARGDILLILDADLTMPPEVLPRYYQALVSGQADFVNGVRLVYPMEQEAMQFLNLLGNKLFGLAFSWLIGQPVKDTLCGTKGLWKRDYIRIAANRAYFGDFDPFGDFDLLFGAARLSLRIIDIPIRYRQRTYGTTNIHRWRHGLLLLQMVVFAARRLRFI